METPTSKPITRKNNYPVDSSVGTDSFMPIIKRALDTPVGGDLGRSIFRQESQLKWAEGDIETKQQHAASRAERKPVNWWRQLSCIKKSGGYDQRRSLLFEQEMEDFTRNKSKSFSRRALESKKRKGRPSSLLNILLIRGSNVFNNDLSISKVSRMQKLVLEMRECVFMLENILAPEERLEEWACVVYESMSAMSRTFHGVQHVFDISVDADKIQKLAAFFHDCIYYNIDGGLSPVQKSYLSRIIIESDEGVYLTKDSLEEKVEIVSEIFGFEKGQQLNPFKGLNEYLSAVLAVRCFADFLSSRNLLEVAACIEATIPFREGDPMDELYQRLLMVNEKYDLGMNHAEIEITTVRAADFANRDVYNFALTNRAVFLSNTWNLLPESNINLRAQVFRISDFALALQKMTGFFSTLKAETIFSSFRNQPSNEVVADLTGKAKENIKIALKYMECKRLSIAVLAAFAELTGGDAPVVMFLGDLPDAHHISPSIEDMIRIKKRKKGVKLDNRVLELLKEGRECESEFDIKKSPCAALLYSEMGDEGLEQSLKHVAHPMDESHAKALLLSLPKCCVKEIGLACCHIAITRSEEIRKIVEKINAGSNL